MIEGRILAELELIWNDFEVTCSLLCFSDLNGSVVRVEVRNSATAVTSTQPTMFCCLKLTGFTLLNLFDEKLGYCCVSQ